METKKIKAVLLLLFCTFFLSCSDDESSVQNGGDVFRYQAVVVNLNNVNLSQLEYQGTLGGDPITLLKSSSSSLTFMVPSTATLGNVDLVVTSLSNFKISYNVKDLILSDTPDNIVNPLIGYMQNFKLGLDTSINGNSANYAVNTFENYYTTSNNQEKEEIAKLYQANKVLFDAIFQNDFSSFRVVNGLSTRNSSLFTFANLKKAAIGVAMVAAIAVTAPTVGAAVGASFLIAATVGGIVWDYNSYNIEYIEETLVNVRVSFNDIVGTNLRSTQSTFVPLLNNISEIIVFNTERRGIIASDVNSEAPEMVEYFDTFTLSNSQINTLNPFLASLNTNQGTTYSSYDENELPTTSPSTTSSISTTDFSNVVLSIDNQNLQLVSYTMQGNGQLNVKVKVIGNGISYPVTGSLKYSYANNVSKFNGSVPIEVSLPFVGNWALESFENGVLPGVYVQRYSNASCPNIATDSYTVNSETFTFTSTSFVNNGQNTYKNYQLGFSGCTIISDGSDTIDISDYGGNQTYVINGSVLTATDQFGDVESANFEFITQNKLKLGDRVYVRQ